MAYIGAILRRRIERKKVIRKLRESGAECSENDANNKAVFPEKAGITKNEQKWLEDLIKHGKAKKLPDGRVYIPKK
ncbi:MAG: hypothetical protein OEX77_01085 [Candidatus Bathyarchaeota archaeon]|nr:hypothetical protein [Candidatus Bathyarchaeota archaeon]MDH5732721.1 hypothetical protein [Candidatus Bathyarchaeota archaeon]